MRSCTRESTAFVQAMVQGRQPVSPRGLVRRRALVLGAWTVTRPLLTAAFCPRTKTSGVCSRKAGREKHQNMYRLAMTGAGTTGTSSAFTWSPSTWGSSPLSWLRSVWTGRVCPQAARWPCLLHALPGLRTGREQQPSLSSGCRREGDGRTSMTCRRQRPMRGRQRLRGWGCPGRSLQCPDSH